MGPGPWVKCPECRTVLNVPPSGPFIRCGACSMMLTLSEKDGQPTVVSVIIDEEVVHGNRSPNPRAAPPPEQFALQLAPSSSELPFPPRQQPLTQPSQLHQISGLRPVNQPSSLVDKASLQPPPARRHSIASGVSKPADILPPRPKTPQHPPRKSAPAKTILPELIKRFPESPPGSPMAGTTGIEHVEEQVQNLSVNGPPEPSVNAPAVQPEAASSKEDVKLENKSHQRRASYENQPVEIEPEHRRSSGSEASLSRNSSRRHSGPDALTPAEALAMMQATNQPNPTSPQYNQPYSPRPPTPQSFKCSVCGQLLLVPPGLPPGLQHFQCGTCKTLLAFQVEAQPQEARPHSGGLMSPGYQTTQQQSLQHQQSSGGYYPQASGLQQQHSMGSQQNRSYPQQQGSSYPQNYNPQQQQSNPFSSFSKSIKDTFRKAGKAIDKHVQARKNPPPQAWNNQQYPSYPNGPPPNLQYSYSTGGAPIPGSNPLAPPSSLQYAYSTPGVTSPGSNPVQVATEAVSSPSYAANPNPTPPVSPPVQTHQTPSTPPFQPQVFQPPPPPPPQYSISVNRVGMKEEDVLAAEAKAGPIQRGIDYWYDAYAGFWGLWGRPCQGIIPPGIPQFKDLLLPPEASGGTTGVFVNGRQLAARDLHMLQTRGFPNAPGASYWLTIQGVLSYVKEGAQVADLGKLAVTVEVSGKGAGMRGPPQERKPQGAVESLRSFLK